MIHLQWAPQWGPGELEAVHRRVGESPVHLSCCFPDIPSPRVNFNGKENATREWRVLLRAKHQYKYRLGFYELPANRLWIRMDVMGQRVLYL